MYTGSIVYKFRGGQSISNTTTTKDCIFEREGGGGGGQTEELATNSHFVLILFKAHRVIRQENS